MVSTYRELVLRKHLFALLVIEVESSQEASNAQYKARLALMH
jgi:hypothetical protein